MAPKYDPADANKDNKVTPKEQRQYDKKNLKPDTLSAAELAKKYGYALKIMKSDEEVWTLFQKAANAKKGQWTTDRFIAELMATQWWSENNEYARKAMAAEAMGGDDWNTMLETARLQVQSEATNQGVDLDDEQLNDLAEQTIANGWDQAGRGQLLTNALSSLITAPEDGTFMGGRSGDYQQAWMQTAARNGVNLSRNFFESKARAVASDLATPEEVDREIREQAASFWPTFSKQIMGGMDARDLASGYINTMAQEFEIDPEMVSLNDPLLRQAMTGVSEDGAPSVEGLWAFQQRLRQDPRWMQTRQAAMEISSTARSVMEMFGLVG